jgi:hypothetical protein
VGGEQASVRSTGDCEKESYMYEKLYSLWGEQANVRSTGDCEKREVTSMKSCTLCGGEQASVRSTGECEKRE